MTIAKTTIVAVAVLLFVTPGAFAQPPLEGVYTSTDLGGEMLTGRYSESWINGDRMDLGNAIHAASYDGNNGLLGTQWTVMCPMIVAPPLLIEDTVNSKGDGYRKYLITLAGGNIVLSGLGPWGGGAAEYVGVVDSYLIELTINYAKNEEISVTCTINLSATLLDYPQSCLTMTVDKCVERDNTDGKKILPRRYPDFVNGNCETTPKDGAWGEYDGITIAITGCTTPTEESSWGSVKSRYQNSD